MKLLDTIPKRAGALVVAAGAVTLAFGVHRLYWLSYAPRCVLETFGATGCEAVRWGFWAIVAGVALPFVWHWLIHGKAPRHH